MHGFPVAQSEGWEFHKQANRSPVRDEFSKSTREKIAKRAGYHCSKPDCGVPTIGAARGHDGVMNIGVAAHITAASLGGPRYDAALTSEERRGEANGVWLCQTHGTLVDADGVHFTVEMLRDWKGQAADRSFRAVIEGWTPPSQGPAIREVLTRLADSAKRDLDAFKRMAWWPRHPIALRLRIPEESGRTFTTSDLAKTLSTFEQPVIMAPPGTGKTTTLVQLAYDILALGQQIPLFLPLGEWASQADSLMGSVTRRQGFAGAADDLIRLAHTGLIVFLLDGWNELDAIARKRATDELKLLQRDFPDIGIVVSTRRQALPLPLSGPFLEISALGEDQQLEMARALRGVEGERLLDHAWRTRGVRELVTLPLYLTALLTDTTDAALPTTKDAVLRLFVTRHERIPDHIEALRESALGFHSEMLTALATAGLGRGRASIPDAQAQAAIGKAEDELVRQRQLMAAPEPMKILDALVNHHLLVRSDSGTITFQHQQFQEWYASFEVESLMRRAASGDAQAREALRAERLDVRAWEEAILFACERLSANEPGPAAASIREAMGIDPVLAAEMIFRSSESVWEQIRDEIVGMAHRWHTADTVDRAVGFMIGTGRPEFAPDIWPLILSSNDQIQLEALRANRRFRTSVLGPDYEDRIAGLPEAVRSTLLAEMAHFGGLDGLELAARMARQDMSPAIKSAVIEGLLFRRAERLAEVVLADAPDEVWKSLAERGYAQEMIDGEAAARLRREREILILNTTDPIRRLHLLVEGERGATAADAVAAVIEHEDFPVQDQHGSAQVYRAGERFPDAVHRALLSRLRRGLPIPFRTEDLLQAAGLSLSEGPLVELAVHGDSKDRQIGAAAVVFGQPTIARLMNTLSALTDDTSAEGRDRATWERQQQLISWISISASQPFAQALLNLPATSDPAEIALRANLVARHGHDDVGRRLPVEEGIRQQLSETIEHWAAALLVSDLATRDHFAQVAQAIERVGTRELVPVLQRLFTEDLTRWRRARAERAISPAARKEASTSYTLQYERAFAAIGGEEVAQLMMSYLDDPDFAVNGASVLKTIWLRSQQGDGEVRPVFGIDFSSVAERRLERAHGRGSARSSPLTEPILAALERLVELGLNERDHDRTLELARIAFSMPYGTRRRLIDVLLRLPASEHRLRDLLTTLALAGEIIPFDLVVAEVRKRIEEAQAQPWLLDPNQSRLDGWLALLAFCDHVDRIPEVIESLGHGRYLWHLRSLVSALAYSPDAGADAVLGALARQQPALVVDHDWLRSVIRRGTAAAVSVLLDRIAEGVSGSNPGQVHWGLSRSVAAFISRNTEVRALVYERYETRPDDPARPIVESAMAEAADREAVGLLIRGYAEQGKAFDGLLQIAIRSVALGERPAPGWSGAKEIIAVPVPDLRRDLFRLIETDVAVARLAEASLVAIDVLRDEYGVVESEPRHPDVSSGRPWPRLQR